VLAWHLGLTPVIVWSIFHDPRMDFRFLLVGSVLPDVVDVVWLDPRYGHTLVVGAALLVGSVSLTRRGTAVRRAAVAVAIGFLLHLALDGIWTERDVFWWPFFGTDFPEGRLWPRGWSLVVQEAAGLVALRWFAARFHLDRDRVRRRRFLAHGTVSP
jgi:hypothetical protein